VSDLVETTTATKTEAAATKAAKTKATIAKKAKVKKTWMIVGVLIVLALGGINLYYMKKNKDLKDKLAEVERLAALEAAKDKPTVVEPRDDKPEEPAEFGPQVDGTEGA
jgi:uncharacterized protein (UPF0333 family)